MKVVLDSNILIYAIHGDETINDYLAQFDADDLAISVITFCEILIGFRKHSVPQHVLRRRLLEFPILAVSQEIGTVFGQLTENLDPKESKKHFNDLLIAATALYFKLPILTNNKKDFEGIPGLKILSIAD